MVGACGLFPRERACKGRRKTGWKLGECGHEGKVGVWKASGKDPVHTQEKGATEKNACINDITGP